MRSTLLAGALALTTVLGAAGTASAAPKPPKPPVVKTVTKPAPKKASVVVYAGTVVSVDGAVLDVTVTVSGGRNKPARNTTMTFAVPSTAIVKVDGVVATLADVEPGDAVDVKGLQSGTTFTVTALNVTSPSA